MAGAALNGASWIALGIAVLRPGRRNATGALIAGLIAALVVGAVAACAPAPSAFVPPPSVRPAATVPQDGARVPVIVDTDLDADDLLALMVLLAEPTLEVRAVAITGTGLAHCRPGLVTVGRLLVALGAASIPVACGREDPGPDGRAFPADWRAAADAAYGLEHALPPDPGFTRPTPGTASIVGLYRDVVGAAEDGSVTVVGLGPWTNLEDVFAADPSLVPRVRLLHAMLGAIDAPGNVEIDTVEPGDGVEWNAAADPSAVAAVLALDIPVTLVPLDATDDVPVPRDVSALLEGRGTSAAMAVARELYARSPSLGGPGRFWWDPLAALTFAVPSLAAWEDVAVTVDTGGDSAGRVRRADRGRPIRAAVRADAEGVTTALLDALERGSEPILPQGWSMVSGAAGLRVALPPWLVPFDTTGAVFANEVVPAGTGLQLLVEGGRTAEPQPGAQPVEQWLAGRLDSPIAGRAMAGEVALDAGPAVTLHRIDGPGTPGAWRIAAWAIRTPSGTAALIVDGPVAAWAGREADVERIAELLRDGWPP